MDERRAIERLKGGDIGGLEALVRLHHTRAVRAVDLIVHDTALSHDIVQAAFVRFYERIRQFDAGRPFGPYFMKIVVNDAIKAASRRERTVSFYRGDTEDLLSRLADPGTGPHEQAEEAETQRRVWRALEQLPPAQRAVIVQRYYLGMSEAEMAGSAEIPSGTIKSRLNAARKGLKNLLRPQFRAKDSSTNQEQPVTFGALSADSAGTRNGHE
ncbi:MAG: RNA polymerase sigma factor [Rubrobacter sp.]|nr:RNA polymerase sigma factor [Rubrobacter sp.]